tara:strand:- start:12623 stop:12826 length:204 start_codon:yes stop_codon:yes gene_type:complete
MTEKKKKPTLDSRVKEIESYLNQLLTSMDTLLDRVEYVEQEVDNLKAENMRLNSELAYIKPRVGLTT